MRLQIASTLAIFALVDLARTPDQQRSVTELGEHYDVSAHHLSKVMKVLVRAGLVRSLRGIGGGYRLACNPRRVTLYDVVSLFEDLTTPGADAFGTTPAGRVLGSIMAEIHDIAGATLSTITLATMIKLMAEADEAMAGPAASSQGGSPADPADANPVDQQVDGDHRTPGRGSDPSGTRPNPDPLAT